MADSEELDLGEIPIRVITLERLIAIEEKLTRPKDQVMLLVLRATLDERRRS